VSRKVDIEARAEELVTFETSSRTGAWIVSYADIMTIILTFFILIFSVSRISSSRYEQLASAFGNQPERSVSDVQSDLQGIVDELGMEQRVRIERTDDGLFIELENSILFDSGEAELHPESAALLRPIGERLSHALGRDYGVVVEGYTDDVPIRNARFRSNWELSSSRAIYVMEELVAAGVPQERISVQAFADTRAQAPALGEASPEAVEQARASDRRVVLRVSDIRRADVERRGETP